MNYLKHALKRMMFLAKEKNVDITDFYFPLHDVYGKRQTANSRQLRVTKA